MGVDSKAFANDPHSNEKRNDMIRSARALLSAVTRLLCIADMADVYRLLASLRLVSNIEVNGCSVNYNYLKIEKYNKSFFDVSSKNLPWEVRA